MLIDMRKCTCITGSVKCKLPSPIIALKSSHVDFPSQKNHLMTMCFTCPILFSVMFYVLPGMQNVPTYFFGSLFIKYAVPLFVNTLSPFWILLFDSILNLATMFLRFDAFFVLFYHLCFQLLDFLLRLCFPSIHHRRKKEFVEARMNVFTNFLLNNRE